MRNESLMSTLASGFPWGERGAVLDEQRPAHGWGQNVGGGAKSGLHRVEDQKRQTALTGQAWRDHPDTSPAGDELDEIQELVVAKTAILPDSLLDRRESRRRSEELGEGRRSDPGEASGDENQNASGRG